MSSTVTTEPGQGIDVACDGCRRPAVRLVVGLVLDPTNYAVTPTCARCQGRQCREHHAQLRAQDDEACGENEQLVAYRVFNLKWLAWEAIDHSTGAVRPGRRLPYRSPEPFDFGYVCTARPLEAGTEKALAVGPTRFELGLLHWGKPPGIRGLPISGRQLPPDLWLDAASRLTGPIDGPIYDGWCGVFAPASKAGRRRCDTCAGSWTRSLVVQHMHRRADIRFSCDGCFNAMLPRAIADVRGPDGYNVLHVHMRRYNAWEAIDARAGRTDPNRVIAFGDWRAFNAEFVFLSDGRADLAAGATSAAAH